jgi:hypothetical protein
MPPQMPPNRLPINNFNPHTRPFSSDYISQPNPINPNVNFGNFGSLGPTGGFYPAPVYDPYGHYPMPPPPNYGYPPGPVFFLHIFYFFIFSDLYFRSHQCDLLANSKLISINFY